jgi:aldose 1-epimerase
MPSNAPTGDRFLHGVAHTAVWQPVTVAPDALTAELTPAALTPTERAGYPFDVTLRATFRLEGAALRVALEAHNAGDAPAPVGLGLHPYFDPTLLGGDRGQARMHLPGRQTRLGRPVPSGEREAVDDAPVSPAPLGEQGLISRTDLEPGGAVRLTGATERPALTITLLEGVNDLLVFSPAEDPSISIEPLSQPPSAASQPEGHPDGLIGLEPCARRRLVVEFRVDT